MIDPALMLGTAVVKTACKIWLKDNSIATDAAVGVVDIIRTQVGSVREQRKIRRLFEDLEERVADNILNSLDEEFSKLPANEREAAVLAVRDTFDTAQLTNHDLFAADLDVMRLLRTLRPLGPRFTDSLSQDATGLYGRILHDCCAYIVELANVLPGFQVGVFSEILSRQNELTRLVDQRFDQLFAELGGAGAETFEPTYRRVVVKQLDKVELFGVTVSERVGNYPLSVAYVSLSICSTAIVEDGAFSGLINGPVKPERRVTSIEDALGVTKRAFIRGEAGSGKTTLLQWLAVRCGRREFDGPMRDWNGCVPLFIRLRRYSGTELPKPEDFLHEVGRNIAHTMPVGWVHDLLAAGRAVVLVDGVDELPESQRRRARDWLRELLLTYPYARYVVTSRPAAAAESWLDGEGFDVLEIEPMTTADIDAFVSHWHAALADGVSNATERERIEASRQELMQTIRTHRYLRMLTVNPLMTALICALHLDRRMQLPHDRMELYSIALEMLLERRDTERQIQGQDVTVSRADKTLILEDLAYWLVRNGWSDASKARVLERLAAKLSNMHHRVHAGPGEMLNHLLDRSGLLRMPADGQIDFVHKTFQEFLAARAAVSSDDIGVLAEHAHDDHWREVILMAVGHASPRQTEELLLQILKRADLEENHRYVLHILAVGCIQHAPQLSPELRSRLQDIAAVQLPPRRMSQAVALAGAGDLALELLSTHTTFSTTKATATIRMAAIIGGDHAMSIIARCAENPGQGVHEELVRAWPKFEPESFAQRVLSKAHSMSSVTIEDPSLLAGIKHLDLQALTCDFVHGYGNVEYVLDAPNLTYLRLHDPQLTDLAPISDHPNLTNLELSKSGGPFNILPLARCKSLSQIDLALKTLDDIHQLRELSNVTSLQLIDEAAPTTVLSQMIEGLRLNRFGLWEALSMDDLHELTAAQQLSDLNFLLLGRAGSLVTIAGIDRWSETMTGIYLHAKQLTDIERISTLKLLKFANLARTPIKSLDFIRGNSRLNRLHIGGSIGTIPDLAPLCDLPSLQYLHIWGTQPVDVSGLARATDLRVEVAGQRDRPIRGRDSLPPSVVVQRSVRARRRY